MSRLSAVSTYLPTWRTSSGVTVGGRDEDAVTMAVAAGRGALAVSSGSPEVSQVVLVTRDLPLLEGGNAAVLLGGLGLPDTLPVAEQLGGAPATLDAVASAGPGTLVLAAELGTTAGGAGPGSGAGAAAALVVKGEGLEPAGRVQRSLPLRVRGLDGVVVEDHDPRLQRERGVRVAVERAGLTSKPVVVAGLGGREAAELCEGTPPAVATLGASSPLFALASLAEERRGGLVVAVEQASLAAARFDPVAVAVHQVARPPVHLPEAEPAAGPPIRFAYTAYERAFEAKVRWEAARCPVCATLALPPRLRCLGCGQEGGHVPVPLPRRGVVYTTTTVHTPVPGLTTPYSLAVVSLDGVDVRALVTIADAPAGSVAIDDTGTLVLRRVAVRTGVPDYGYAFQPDLGPGGQGGVA